MAENLFIQPFKRTSDITVNSIHIYEPCVLCHDALALLNSIHPASEFYDTAMDLKRRLSRFVQIDAGLVPPGFPVARIFRWRNLFLKNSQNVSFLHISYR